MNTKVDVHGILERAGADVSAPEGSQAWALAQVDGLVGRLIENHRVILRVLEDEGRSDDPIAGFIRAILVRIGGAQ